MKFFSIRTDEYTDGAGTVRAAAEAIRAGLLVAFPTETVYGLGADCFNPAALARVFEVKGRPRFDPLIVHIAEPGGLERVADTALLDSPGRRRLERLIRRFWPGPLTIILPKQPAVPDLATSGLPTVAVRLPAHPVARDLIRLSTGAVAAPSANLFGRLSPTRAEHVRDQLGERVDVILDGGPCTVGVESTVLDLCAGEPRVLRPGGVSREELEALIGPLAGPASGETRGDAAPARSPGQLKSHYAPRTPLSVHARNEISALPYEAGEARLFFDAPSRDAWLETFRPRVPEGRALVLSEQGNLIEAAARLFELLHALDGLGASRIRAELLPDRGLGPAVNDRLMRAAVR
ncbi:MAG: threonylcarbamoyl-AMP synthase [Spirochaetaceae bacterium]|jgi:L-threonylcarbamoyladenylate synthase|nr:threonylcarbamoyl-AMP synthase [Spirochaetaceae bacterium]